MALAPTFSRGLINWDKEISFRKGSHFFGKQAVRSRASCRRRTIAAPQNWSSALKRRRSFGLEIRERIFAAKPCLTHRGQNLFIRSNSKPERDGSGHVRCGLENGLAREGLGGWHPTFKYVWRSFEKLVSKKRRPARRSLRQSCYMIGFSADLLRFRYYGLGWPDNRGIRNQAGRYR